MKKVMFIFFLFVFFYANTQVITNYPEVALAFPFLELNSNSRINSMGNIGVVSTNYYQEEGLFQNPSLLSGCETQLSASVGYMPYLRNIIPDNSFSNLSGLYSFDKRNAVGYNFMFFNLSEFTFTDSLGNQVGQYQPYELAHQLTYSHSFKSHLALGAAFKYIQSDLGGGYQNDAYNKVNSFALDFGANQKYKWNINENTNITGVWGISLNNLGPKIKYFDSSNSTESYIPSFIRIGAMINPEINLNEKNTLNIEIAYQADKSLIPMSLAYKTSFFEGVFKSFYDAPGGFQEEMHEIIHKLGLETRFDFSERIFIAIRCGRFSEHETKGNRKYGTYGIGVGANGFTFDCSIWNGENISIDNTFVLSLGYKKSFLI